MRREKIYIICCILVCVAREKINIICLILVCIAREKNIYIICCILVHIAREKKIYIICCILVCTAHRNSVARSQVLLITNALIFSRFLFFNTNIAYFVRIPYTPEIYNFFSPFPSLVDVKILLISRLQEKKKRSEEKKTYSLSST